MAEEKMKQRNPTASVGGRRLQFMVVTKLLKAEWGTTVSNNTLKTMKEKNVNGFESR